MVVGETRFLPRNLWRELSFNLFHDNDYVLSDPGFDGFPAMDFRTLQYDRYLKGKMADRPIIGERFEDDCKLYKMTFLEAILTKFHVFLFDRSEEDNVPFDKCVMIHPESLLMGCLYSSYITQSNQLLLDNDDEQKVICSCYVLFLHIFYNFYW